MWSGLADFNTAHPYISRIATNPYFSSITGNPYIPRIIPGLANGTAVCDSCKEWIHQGPFFREFCPLKKEAARVVNLINVDCTKCREYDLCGQCYEAGKTCLDKTHGMVKHYAYSRSHTQKRSKIGSAYCDICTVELKDENFCFGAGLLDLFAMVYVLT